MLISNYNTIKITGISAALPEQQVVVSEYYDLFGKEAVDSFSEMTGVKSIYRTLPEQTASDLAYIAAKDLITRSEIDISEIGILILVTQKPDVRVPATSYILHKRLGLHSDCMCFDINLACSGYLYALNTCYSLLSASSSRAALVLTGDTSSRTISPSDRTMAMLFGDSGTASLLEKSNDPAPAYFAMRTDGKRFKSIITPSGAYRNIHSEKERMKWSDDIERSDYDTHMKGMEVFGFSITDVPKLMKELMSTLQTTQEDYAVFALHQANLYILKQISRKLKIPQEKIPICLDRYGNNSSNSIPLVLTDAFGSNSKKSALRTMMSGFGAGLSWACADIEIDPDIVHPTIFSNEYLKEKL